MSNSRTYRMGLITTVVLGVELLVWVLMLGSWWLLDTEVPKFRFERPYMLWGLLGGPMLVLIILAHIAWRNKALLRLASPDTLGKILPGISPTRTILRAMLLRHGLGMVVIALAAPQYGTRQEEVKAEGIDLVVALDVSNSMLCEDLKPNRMGSARRAMERLIDQMKGDRLGIVVFAGEAFVQLPITTDRSAAKLFLSTIGTHSVSTQGTAIGTAIELAARGFEEESAAGKAIIVITDGENHEDDAEGAARTAREEGIIVHTIGMGTPQGGPIPMRRNGQLSGFRKDRSGSTVVSRLDEGMLQRIADAGGGSYIRATDRSSGIEELAEELRGMDRAETGSYRFTAHADQYQYPLGMGMILLLLGLAFGERSRSRPRWMIPLGLRGSTAAWLLLFLAGCGDSQQRIAEAALFSGNGHYRDGAFHMADSSYATAPMDHRVVYNRGNAAYRQALWGHAISHFHEATALADSTPDRPRAMYNLGNARLMRSHWADSMSKVLSKDIAGITVEGSDIVGKLRLAVHRDSLRQTKQQMDHLVDSALTEGATAYKKCLRLEPDAEDARYNLSVANALIAARKKARENGDNKDEKDKALSERARLLIEKADELVDQYRFVDALELLQRGLKEEPTLEQRKEYVDKLETVKSAAQGQ